MITKAERRIVAIIMAAMTGAVTVSTTGLAVYAEDNSTSIKNIEIGKQLSLIHISEPTRPP